MHRLPVPSALLEDDAPAALPKNAAQHLKVLRPKPGETIELFDGAGAARLYTWNGTRLAAAAPRRTAPPPARRITLFAAITKGSRWDWTIEKAVELGVSRIVPVLSERCIVRIAPAERPAKLERWQRIAEDAARQSAAMWTPEILPATDFASALALVAACRPCFAGALVSPAPEPLAKAAARLMPASAEAGMIVGPEGDFTPTEYAALLETAVPVSFGPSVLRSETAAIFGVAVVAALAADML